jgi:hypothetical protein
VPARFIKFVLPVFAIILIAFKTDAIANQDNPDLSPMWIAHASSPGPDYPIVGYSVFDRLFLQGNEGIDEYRIPYPFGS